MQQHGVLAPRCVQHQENFLIHNSPRLAHKFWSLYSPVYVRTIPGGPLSILITPRVFFPQKIKIMRVNPLMRPGGVVCSESLRSRIS